jgi:hypothetical protein
MRLICSGVPARQTVLDSPRLVPRQDKTELDRVRSAIEGRIRLLCPGLQGPGPRGGAGAGDHPHPHRREAGPGELHHTGRQSCSWQIYKLKCVLLELCIP